MLPENHVKLHTLIRWRDMRVKLVLQSLLVGILSGLVVVLYRYLLEIATQGSHTFYQAVAGHPLHVLATFILLAAAGLMVGLLVQAEPLISGSGIPQVEGHLLRKINMNWWRIVLGKMVGGVISLGAGLSLGREGPSVQIGSAMGLGLSRVLGRDKVEEKYLVTAGASAGLAAAFNAPLAGIIFALEEVHRHFSPLILLSASTAALMADFISKEFFGLNPVFTFHNIAALPLHNYGLLIGLGVLLGLLGAVFNRALVGGQKLFQWLPVYLRPILPFLGAGALALLLPQAIGGGHHLIETVVDSRMLVTTVALLLVIKFAFTIFCYGSGAPGGIFLPLLALGALFGNLYGQSAVQILGLNPDLASNFTILAMAGMFAGIVRAPITGTVLITEMTGSFSHLLALSIVSITAHVTADLLRSEPVYESLLGRLLAKAENVDPGRHKERTLLEIPVCLDSEFDGRAIRELNLPGNCLLVGVTRGGEDLIPRGDTIIASGDIITVLTSEANAAKVNHMLLALAGKCNLEQSS